MVIPAKHILMKTGSRNPYRMSLSLEEFVDNVAADYGLSQYELLLSIADSETVVQAVRIALNREWFRSKLTFSVLGLTVSMVMFLINSRSRKLN